MPRNTKAKNWSGLKNTKEIYIIQGWVLRGKGATRDSARQLTKFRTASVH